MTPAPNFDGQWEILPAHTLGGHTLACLKEDDVLKLKKLLDRCGDK